MEAAERARVERAALDRQRALAVGVAQDDLADGLLGHHVPPDQRTLGAVHLEAGDGIFGGEAVMHLRDEPGAEADCRHDPVLHARLRQPRGLDDGDDLLRLVVENEAQGVGIVHGDVEHDAAAGLGPGDAPALKMRRQKARMEHPCGDGLADETVLDGLVHRPVRAGVAQMVVRAHHDAGALAGVDHGAGILDDERERLFAEHVLARPRGGESLGLVHLVRSRNVDRLDLRIGKERFEGGRVPRDAVLLRIARAALRIARQHGDEFPVRLTQGVDHVFAGDSARSDQSPACRHATFLPA